MRRWCVTFSRDSSCRDSVPAMRTVAACQYLASPSCTTMDSRLYQYGSNVDLGIADLAAAVATKALIS